jgi:hypothetical protein
MPLITSALICALLHAADPTAVAIARAQDAAIRKDRAQASSILREALQHTGSRTARQRIGEALAQVTRIFFTDQGQRAFETGQTALQDSPEAALPAFREALRLEDGNVAVRLGLARYHLVRQDCAAAASEVAEARRLDPLDGDAAALDLRVMICQHSFTGLREKVRRLPPLTKWQSSFVAYVQAREMLEQGANRRAAEALGRVVADFPRFPEARFYLSRADATRASGEDSLRRYVALCRSFTGRDRREFALEPRACVHQKEAEDELAKKPAEF